MNGLRIGAIVIILAGILALAYGGFSYTKESTALKLGPVEVKVQEQERVNVPLWAGIAAIVTGGLVLVGAGRKA